MTFNFEWKNLGPKKVYFLAFFDGFYVNILPSNFSIFYFFAVKPAEKLYLERGELTVEIFKIFDFGMTILIFHSKKSAKKNIFFDF